MKVIVKMMIIMTIRNNKYKKFYGNNKRCHYKTYVDYKAIRGYIC